MEAKCQLVLLLAHSLTACKMFVGLGRGQERRAEAVGGWLLFKKYKMFESDVVWLCGFADLLSGFKLRF